MTPVLCADFVFKRNYIIKTDLSIGQYLLGTMSDISVEKSVAFKFNCHVLNLQSKACRPDSVEPVP